MQDGNQINPTEVNFEQQDYNSGTPVVARRVYQDYQKLPKTYILMFCIMC